MNQNHFQRLVEQGFNRSPVAREELAFFEGDVINLYGSARVNNNKGGDGQKKCRHTQDYEKLPEDLA